MDPPSAVTRSITPLTHRRNEIDHQALGSIPCSKRTVLERLPMVYALSRVIVLTFPKFGLLSSTSSRAEFSIGSRRLALFAPRPSTRKLVQLWGEFEGTTDRDSWESDWDVSD